MKIRIYDTCRKIYNDLLDNIQDIRKKLNNLTQTNHSLAVHHLKNGRINDAILRLYIIVNFIDTHHPSSKYLLAQLLAIKGYTNKSIKLLQSMNDIDEEANILLEILTQTHMHDFPLSYIQNIYFALQHDTQSTKYLYDLIYDKFITSNKINSILQIGIGTYLPSLILLEYRTESEQEYTLHAADLLDDPTYQKELGEICDSVTPYHKASNKKHDIVIFNLVNYHSHFTSLIKHCSKVKKGGIMAFMCRCEHNNPQVEYDNIGYIHSITELEDCIEQLEGFSVLHYEKTEQPPFIEAYFILHLS